MLRKDAGCEKGGDMGTGREERGEGSRRGGRKGEEGQLNIKQVYRDVWPLSNSSAISIRTKATATATKAKTLS